MAGRGKGQLVNLTELADFLGVTRTYIVNWVKQGCPCETHGGLHREWQFYTADVVRWREDQARASIIAETSKIDEREARRQKIATEAALLQYDLAERRALVMRITDIDRELEKRLTALRGKLLSVSPKLAPIIMPDDPARAEAILESAMVEALEELTVLYDVSGRSDTGDSAGGDGGFRSSLEGAGQEVLEAAAEAYCEPVGGHIPTAKPGGKRRTRKVDDSSR